MRNFLLLVVSVLSLLAAVGFLSLYSARKHKAPAEEFLRLIGENKLGEAFDSTSSSFQQAFKWEAFRRFVTRFHLADYQPGSFRLTGSRTDYTREFGLVIRLEGDTALRDGTHFHTTIMLRRESGLWKVNHIWVKFPDGFLEHPTPTPFPAGTDAAFESKPLTLSIRPIQIDPSRSIPAANGNEHRDASLPASASPTASPTPSF